MFQHNFFVNCNSQNLPCLDLQGKVDSDYVLMYRCINIITVPLTVVELWTAASVLLLFTLKKAALQMGGRDTWFNVHRGLRVLF